MRNIPLYNLKENIKDLDLILAHLNENKEDETLYQHSNKTIDYFYRVNELKDIESALDNIINKITIRGKYLGEEAVYLLKEFFVNAIYLHDIGKINPAFQKIKMKNKNIDSYVNNSEHSLISALIYIDIFSRKVVEIPDKRLQRFMGYLMYLNSYCIAKHHSYLKNIDSFLSDLETLHRRIIKKPEYIKYYLDSSNIANLDFTQDKNRFASRGRIQRKEDYPYMEIYIFMKLLYSCIISCDFYATYDYMNSEVDDFGIITDVDYLKKQYESTDLYASIEDYKLFKIGEIREDPYKDIPINRLRTEMFLEAEENLMENIDGNIFYLEAPTGGGKTNISINLALNILKEKEKYNKIFYIFPFNSLIEQTKKSLDNLFKEINEIGQVAVVNSITPIITFEESSEEEILGSINYEKHLLNRQFMHYPIVLTSHINFFNYLFGIGKEVNFPFIHLCNSVVIIDEIQSYRNDIWKEMIIFFDKYAKMLNMKIIIMSATLPKLDKLIGSNRDSTFIELIENKEKYYKSTFFKDRVKLNFDMLKMKDINIDDVVEFVNATWEQKKEARILVEFITKKDARIFYNKMVEKNPDKLIVELTGDDNKLIRKKILENLKSKKDGQYTLKNILVISTQVIEAGIDIDMDIGFKDISILDSEEQFLGRINRSCMGEGEAYFFNLTNPKLVYKNDYRTQMGLLNEEYQDFLLQKDFEKFYFNCFESIEESKNQFNQNNIENFISDLRYLSFDDICKKMKLIQDNDYQIYLASKISDEDGEIDGKEIWQDYISLIEDKDMHYAEKKIKLSYLYEKMDYFLYNVNRKPRIEKQVVGNIYYIENGEDFMIDGKFDREKFKEVEEGLFL